MQPSHPAQFSFAGGEQSSLMDSSVIRVDEPIDSATSLENFFVTKDGPIARRRGSLHSSLTVPTTRIIPFLGDLLLFGNVGGIDGFSIRSLSYQDDDLAVFVRGIPFSNTRLNVARYYGAQEGVTNNLYSTGGFRELRFRKPESSYNPPHAKLFPFVPSWGDLVSVYTFDGWGSSWRTAPWEATIYFVNGQVRVVTGGSVSTGPSTQQPPFGPTYFTDPYHFETLIPNGFFTLDY